MTAGFVLWLLMCGVIGQWKWLAKDIARFINLVKFYMQDEEKPGPGLDEFY